MQRTDATFIVRGRVGKGIFHNTKNGVTTTSFNLGVVKGKKQDNNYEWESIPILAFGDYELTTGEYVTAVGRISVSRKERQTSPILLCDSIGRCDSVVRSLDRPCTPEERSDNFYGNNSSSSDNFPSDSNIPF